jgi:hypothetical protein
MTVAELIAELEGMNPDAEVRLAHQPSWPFEYDAASVVEVPAYAECANCSEPVPAGGEALCEECAEEETPADVIEAGKEHPAIVYIAEGSQIGYLPGAAAHAIGWTRDR